MQNQYNTKIICIIYKTVESSATQHVKFIDRTDCKVHEYNLSVTHPAPFAGSFKGQDKIWCTSRLYKAGETVSKSNRSECFSAAWTTFVCRTVTTLCFCSAAGIAGFCVRFCLRGDSGAFPPGWTAGSAVPPQTSRRSAGDAAARLACRSSCRSPCADAGSLTSAYARWESQTERADQTEPAWINPPNLEEEQRLRMNSPSFHTVKIIY